ncbi:TetR/AcrR family transcriptional regulator [Chitinophaga sp. G-6-1-13]|uniref:TetR/AcrR family transcriptional regulator n=1 Tax=Chitinophaga fulva TaxID=2728842 RepID=A0A848GI85_9BACT|nr:TetR/AcrR family transcriptional regulator [Chitinophaga fulva]NML38144.1 TetR/AcrR family transcriptional regulator [Chitinophaga fulva]
MARNKEFVLEERLENAKDVFWDKGYYNTSMKDLVNAMSLNPGSIYGTFRDKHQLFLESLKMYSVQTMEDYEQAARSAASPLDAIKAIIHSAVRRSLKEKKACLVVRSTFELAGKDPEVRVFLQQQNKSMVNMMASWINKAQAEKQVSRSKDATQLATFIVANFASIWQMQLLHNDKAMLESLENTLISILTN